MFMKQWSKVGVGLLAAIGGLFVLMMIYTNAFMDCLNERKAVAYSPSGEFSAEVILAQCKGRPDHVRVWLKKTAEKTEHQLLEAISTTTNPISISWVEEQELQITYPRALSIVYTDDVDEDVRIIFLVK
jgi:hypothetical protein